MPLILNIETATEVCSISLSNGDTVIDLKENHQKYSHASQITILIQQCLDEAGYRLTDIDAVAVSKGPGSFTALRIGVATAKGICYSLGKPLIAIDTLQAVALGCFLKEKKEALYCPMIDARRMEVYTAFFNSNNEPIQTAHALIIDATVFNQGLTASQRLVFCGNGAEKCRSVLQSERFTFSSTICSAAHMPILSEKAYLANQFVDLAYFEPFYLKSPNITTPKKLLNL